ncbi:MAG: hypothetical protein OEZ34_15030, partial [Spirochaetia bacterium]|nr:hypothetical protein [Spirochaetia bacterium]
HMSRISHYFVEKYNSNIDRHIDTSSMEFPHQLDQLMINGKRFFEWVEHYRKITIQLRNGEMLFELPHEVFAVLDKYSGRRRDGDKYVRNLFNCALLYYIDKFGMIKIDRAIETFFLWAYSLRLNLQSVQLASVDNHALSEPFIFKRIRDSLKPEEVFAFKIEPPDIRFRSNVKDIIDLFEEYGYA